MFVSGTPARNTSTERRLAAARPGISSKILIPDIGRVADDRVVGPGRTQREEVTDSDVDLHVVGGISDQLLCLTSAAFMHLDAVDPAVGTVGRSGEDFQPLTRGQQEGGFTA